MLVVLEVLDDDSVAHGRRRLCTPEVLGAQDVHGVALKEARQLIKLLGREPEAHGHLGLLHPHDVVHFVCAHPAHCSPAIFEPTIVLQESTSGLYVRSHGPSQCLLHVGAIAAEPPNGLPQHVSSVRNIILSARAHPPQCVDGECCRGVGIICAVIALIVRVGVEPRREAHSRRHRVR